MNNFKIRLLKAALDFINEQPDKVRKKIFFNLNRCQTERNVAFFKKLTGYDIWEFRTEYAGNEYRLLAFWDTIEDTFVIATHGFQKKSQKTPATEIERAIRIRTHYFENKKSKTR